MQKETIKKVVDQRDGLKGHLKNEGLEEKKESIRMVVDERDGLREHLKSAGFEEKRDYNFESSLATPFCDNHYVVTNIDMRADLEQQKKDMMLKIVEDYHGHFVDTKDETDRLSFATKINEEQFQELSKYEDVSKDYNLEEAIGNFSAQSSDTKFDEGEDSPNEEYGEKEDQTEPVLRLESSGPARIKKTFGACVRETFSDRDAQKNAVGCAIVSAVAAFGVQAGKAYSDTPRLEGESRLHKTKRVVSAIARRPKTWMITLGTSVLAYGLSIGCQAGTSMR